MEQRGLLRACSLSRSIQIQLLNQRNVFRASMVKVSTWGKWQRHQGHAEVSRCHISRNKIRKFLPHIFMKCGQLPNNGKTCMHAVPSVTAVCSETERKKLKYEISHSKEIIMNKSFIVFYLNSKQNLPFTTYFIQKFQK